MKCFEYLIMLKKFLEKYLVNTAILSIAILGHGDR